MRAREGCRVARCFLWITLVSAVGCGGDPELEFADWLLPVPEGTPIHEYGPVPIEGRNPQQVQLIEDLVIGSDLGNGAPVLYEPRGIVATEDGNVFVADAGAVDVKMFGPDGEYIKTLGKEGQGPAEFGRVSTMAAAGDHLIVNDTRNRRFSVWTLDGEHVADNAPVERVSMSSLHGLPDGTIVGVTFEQDDELGFQSVITRRTLEGEEVARIFEDRWTPRGGPLSLADPVHFMQTVVDGFDEPRLLFDVAAEETLLLSPGHEYQLVAMSPDGATQWALRVAWPRSPWPENEKEPLIEMMVEGLPIDEPPSPGQLTWPEHAMAVAGIGTDSVGRIYVFPTVGNPNFPDPPDEWPVDVYSPSGEFIAAGVVPFRWTYAAGDYVYGVRPDMYDEMEVVRYRLVVNQ